MRLDRSAHGGRALSRSVLMPREVAAATGCMALWLGIFATGLVIDSSPYRQRLITPAPTAIHADLMHAGEVGSGRLASATLPSEQHDAAVLRSSSVPSTPETTSSPDGRSGLLLVGLIVAFSYTPTNVAMLCLLAATLGVTASRARLGDDATGGQHAGDSTHPYVSGALRGFFVYVALLSGMLVIVGNPFEDLSESKYVRLAGLVSLFAFLLNYYPGLFPSLLAKVGAGLTPPAPDASDAQGPRSSGTPGTSLLSPPVLAAGIEPRPQGDV